MKINLRDEAKKLVALIAVGAIGMASMAFLTGFGNNSSFNTQYTYKRAQVRLFNGEFVDKKVKYWYYYDKGHSIRIRFKDGTDYYSDASNIILYNDK